VLFFISRPRAETHLTLQTIVLGFMAGGTAGVMLTGTVEVYVLPDALFTNTIIGLVEESGKAAIVVLVAAMVTRRVPRDGMVLGAVVGAGFAAFESAGYALGELIADSPRHPVIRVLETEIMRAVFAPFGHIVWTSIMGGALFASAWHTGRFQLDRRVVLTFVGVVALHAAWDAAYGAAILISLGMGGNGWTLVWPNTVDWAGEPTGAELWRYQIVYDAMLVVLSAIGTAWAARGWRVYHVPRWAGTRGWRTAQSQRRGA
jgi:RsiW-degrading membrane proteinase PrsW (M82 family)